jgi:hypothetical protein
MSSPAVTNFNLSHKNSLNMAPQFDLSKHIPPKYDIFGRIKKVQFGPNQEKVNILSELENIRLPWSSKADSNHEPMTRTKLLENRKKEKVPDITYDLDRDGYVGARDYVLAKRYDKNNDGKLDDKERKEAYEAINKNVEDNFVWNLDNQGSNRGYRILQKRGKIVDAEDFMPLRETYPEHPMTSIQPPLKTLNDLKARRKHSTKIDIDEKILKREEATKLMKMNENVNYNIIPASDGPREYQTLKEKKKKEHQQARLNCGLKETEDDIKIKDKDPSLNYVHNPKHKTYKDLKDEIRKENMEESHKLAHQHRKNEIERLNDREDEILEKLYHNNEERFTINKLKEIRKKETLDYNMKTFPSKHLESMAMNYQNSPILKKRKNGGGSRKVSMRVLM